jgi:hypothetical protein
MTLRTGLIITGDTDGAQRALNELEIDINKTAGAAKQLAGAEQVAEAATDALEAELRQARAALSATVVDLNQMRESAAALAGRVDVLETQLSRASIAGRTYSKSMGEQALGARMLGQQFQDMGLMMTMSGFSAESALRAISVQAGQTAIAVEQMGVNGAIGRTAAFLGSPLGAVILTATMVLTPFVAKLFEAGDAADESRKRLEGAASAADSYGDAQSMLGKVIDLTTGKLKTQNSVLIQSIRLQSQLNLLEAQKAIDKATGADKLPLVAGAAGSAGVLGLGGGNIDAAVSANATIGAQQRELDRLKAALTGAIGNDALAQANPEQYARAVNGQLDTTIGRLDKLATGGKFAGKSLIDVKTELLSLATLATNKSAALQSLAVLDGGKPGDDLTPYERETQKRTRKPASTTARDEFGRDAADRIDSITAAFDDTPAAVQQADKAIRQLDDLIDDLGRKKPVNFEALIASAQDAKQVVQAGLLQSLSDAYKAPETMAQKAAPALDLIAGRIDQLSRQKPLGFEKLIADAEAARAVIEEGINRPYTEFLSTQEESLAILQLQARGQDDQAEALRTILSLERQLGPLRDEQKDAILGSVQALRAERREVEILREETQKYIDALSSIEGIVSDASQAFVRGDLGQILKSPEKLLDAFATLKGQQLFDDLFAGVFRDLQDQVNGTSIVRDASARMAGAVDQVTAATGRTTKALDALTRSAEQAGTVGGVASVSGQFPGSLESGIAAAAASALAGVGGGISGGLAGLVDAADEIVVTGRRNAASNPEDLIAKSIGGVATSVAGLLTNSETAKKIGGKIGEFAADGIQGAATGTMVAGISNALGIKMNSTGSQVGGAIGSVTGIPGGSIIGSVLGGLVGNLFSSPKSGTAALTGQGDAQVSGNAGSAKSAATSLAGQVQSGIEQIADQLGGALGNYSVSIGTFDGKYRVNTNATSKSLNYNNFNNSTLKDFGKDGEAEAVAYAIQDAIKDGAVKGLSSAVQQALRSSSDIDDALEEALAVSDVEQLLGGTLGELTQSFKSFETEAADRLRIARQYGLDVVEAEKVNAKERLALTDELMAQQVGSLQSLVDQMTSGSLYEGSSVDQRTAVLEAIAQAETDMNNGVEGAADTLASLYEQLNSVSKEVYGTTGGYAVDRAAILDQARAAIAKANADITAAQAKASDPALATTNAALDENNDQNARMIDAIERNNALLEKALASGGTSTGTLAQLARTS